MRRNIQWDEEMDERLRRYRSQGLTYPEIAIFMGSNQSTIGARCRELGLERGGAGKPRGRPAGRGGRAALEDAARRRLGDPPALAIAAGRRQAGGAVAALTARGKHQCCWPIGDVYEDGFCFCEEVRVPGSPYCRRHVEAMYQCK